MSNAVMMKNVFEWEHFLLYLSGAIDFDRDGGKDWRADWTERLCQISFKRHQILNPCKKPLVGANFNLDNEASIMQFHRERKDWKNLSKVVGEIAHVDLRLVDKSDIILVNMPKMKGTDYQVPTYGTIHEIVVARQQRKPVFMVWEGGKGDCSAWMMWLVGHQNVFDTFDDVLVRLKNISEGKAAYNARDWLLLNLSSSHGV